MKFHQKPLHGAIKLALAVSMAGFAVSAFAQPAAQAPQQASSSSSKKDSKKKAENLQTIVVTGTRLPGINITSSSPVTQVDAKQFKITGTHSVDELVNQMPQLSPYFDQQTNNPTTGYPTADLRGLGTNRTLVLIDGQRVQAGNLFAVDLSQIPAPLIKRVDILTGGASAVYGSDAVAGVVNFVLDDNFEGAQFDYSISGYEHKNRNSYMQGLEKAAGYNAPNGSTGFVGKTTQADAIFGGHFADGRGHAMGWINMQKTDAIKQGKYDYSACALNNPGLACGGSSTTPNPDFYIFDQNFNGGKAHIDSNGNYVAGFGTPYNYAPPNYYQRPDTRVNIGAKVNYDINDAFRPYMSFMYTHRRSAIQVAETGTFYEQTLSIDCTDPAVASLTGTLCGSIKNAYPSLDLSNPLTVYVGKRNVEGGPRHQADTTNSFRTVLGAKGDINIDWSYDVAAVLGQTDYTEVGTGDFLSNRVASAIMGCPSGSFSGCVPYDIWKNGGVTTADAQALQGTSMLQARTRLIDFNGYVRGVLGYSLPWSDGDPISLVAGAEYRKQNYNYTADSNSQEGNFTGSGGPSLPLAGQTSVKELYTEAGIPIIENAGVLTSLGMNLGYRHSDYKLAGSANTFKIGFNSEFAHMFRIRGGFNRAIRAPNVSELFSTQQIQLWGGADPCAGPNPTDTLAQCQNTGVTAAQYGHIPDNPASQYNEYTGGNQNLKPETADTYTFGVAATPIEGLETSLDFYNIKIKNTISSIGSSTILNFCAKTGDPFLCDKVQRNPATGDLWLGQTGRVVNLTDNFGQREVRGLDLNVRYSWQMYGGHASASLVGTRTLRDVYNPLPGVNSSAQYDCAGKINDSCQTPRWRHIANLNYARDWWSVNLRWRYMGSMNYVNTDGSKGTVDQLLVNNGNKLSAYSWFDLSGTFKLGDKTSLTVGVNNITDKEPPLVGHVLSANGNGNSTGGYDSLGRYYFAHVSVKL